MKTWMIAALIVTTLAGCTEDATEEARLVIDFNGQRAGVHDIDTTVMFEPGAFPSAALYDGRDVAHPGYVTVHDLLIGWASPGILQTSYHSGLGFALEGLLGVTSDFHGACWFWELQVNGDAAVAGISATAVAPGDLVQFTYTNCWEDPAAAQLAFDFGSHGNGVDRMQVHVAFDGASHPAAFLYNESTIPQPDHFTVHDLMEAWSGAERLDLVYYDGLGFALDAVDGVAGVYSEDACFYWALDINGEVSQEGMSTAEVADGDVVTWTYTDCS